MTILFTQLRSDKIKRKDFQMRYILGWNKDKKKDENKDEVLQKLYPILLLAKHLALFSNFGKTHFLFFF